MDVNRIMWKYLSLVLFILILILLFTRSNQEKVNKNSIILNQDFIEGLYKTEINLSDPIQVFRYIFTNLEEEVTIYPTENYFYFIFPYKGRIIGGSMNLAVDKRDEGILGFGYGKDREDPSDLKDLFKYDPKDRVGGGKQFTEKDGVYVKKINDFKYLVTFEGKKVIFNLFDVGYNTPKKAKLDESEIFVGPVFDDSGIKL